MRPWRYNVSKVEFPALGKQKRDAKEVSINYLLGVSAIKKEIEGSR